MSEERQRLTNLVNGRLSPPRSGRWLDVHEPATGEVYALVPDSGAEDVAEAVAAAERAAPTWAATPVAERARLLSRLADLVEHDTPGFAEAESRDTGKPVALARRLDIPRAVSNLRFFAAAATQFASESHSMESGGFNYTLRQPLGVVACISPWNLPLYLFTWKIAPALAAGNAVVAKPSEVTPYTAWMLGRLALEAGIPPGVLNIVHGSGPSCGAPLVAHPGVKAISFTGSTKTGAAIAAQAAPQFRKLSLELGGKNPFVVFADADFDRAVDTAVRAAFLNQGQICLCGSRVMIESSIYERFRDAFLEKAAALKPGDPSLPDTEFGAIVSQQHFEKVMGCIALAREEGGRVLLGGQRAHVPGRCAEGWFIAPTVIEGLVADCRTNTEEIFGPVATLMPFDSADEALAMANCGPYGLAASVWSSNLDTAHRFAARVEAGIVWVNCWLLRDLRTPFGGIKQSGVGREGGMEAMRFFTEPRNVCVALGPGA
ncbi:MAG TPA: aldehyde dehydrogenase [Xanthomonadales bacterium]|nr:aldehyde dehydrogenase [Xanthomonadales bacterium]